MLGVPLAEPIAGIAMGLMIDADNESFTVLSDIMGTEDALGDMDFKVTSISGRQHLRSIVFRWPEAPMPLLPFRWMSKFLE